MKMKNSNSALDKIFVHSKIFQGLKVPERSKRLNELQKNVIKLKNSLCLLDMHRNKTKINRIKTKKAILHSLPKSKISNLNQEKKIKKFISFQNFSPQNNNSDNDSINTNSQIKDRKRLYRDKASSLKNKNILLLRKISKKNVMNDNSFNNLYNNNSNNKNEIFMTEFNLPNINAINKKQNSLRKAHTESNNYYENTINIIKYNNNNNIKRNLNNNYKDQIIKSSSDKNLLPPIKLKKEKILYFENSPKFNDNENNIGKNISFTNNSSEENDDIQNIINLDISKQKKNLTIETEKMNSSRRKNLSKLNQKIFSIFGTNNSGKKDEPEIKKLAKKANNISTNFKNRRLYYELEKWIMSSKFKYANWKYGIADINKYFIDMKEFGEQEEKELEMRKSFYEKVNLVINELKEEKEKRELLNIENKYGIKINNEEKKIIKDNEYWIDDQACEKMEEMSKVLKMTKDRKKKEKEKRNLIEEIMFQCKKGVNNINNS